VFLSCKSAVREDPVLFLRCKGGREQKSPFAQHRATRLLISLPLFFQEKSQGQKEKQVEMTEAISEDVSLEGLDITAHEKCAICLGALHQASFLDGCDHEYW
jgi:hypothetical protein